MADLGAMLAPDLRKRIEIMADHIARNGSDFETTVKQKNASNPQFSFLYSGEGAEYYQQVLARHRGTQVPAAAPPAPAAAQPAPVLAPTAPRPPAPPAPPMPQTMPQTAMATGMAGSLAGAPTAGSLATLLRGGQVQGAPPVELADVLRRWKEPQVLALTPEVERQLHGVLASLEHMASRDAIKSGRLWIECNSALAPHIAGHIMVRVSFLSTCAHRLHVLYLVHDLLQTEAARKDAHAPLVRAFKPYLPWILRPCYQLALQSPQGDETSRVLRLVQLWVDRGILSAQEAEEVKAITMTQELPGVQPPVAQAAAAALRLAHHVGAGSASAWNGRRIAAADARRGAVHGSFRGTGPLGLFLTRRKDLQLRESIVGDAAAYRPMLHSYQKQARAAGAEFRSSLARPKKRFLLRSRPETVPVGVLASMLAGGQKALRFFLRAAYGAQERKSFSQLAPALAPKVQAARSGSELSHTPACGIGAIALRVPEAMTPQALPAMEAGRGLGGWEKRGVSLLQQPKVPTPQLLAKVEEFYEDLQDEAGAHERAGGPLLRASRGFSTMSAVPEPTAKTALHGERNLLASEQPVPPFLRRKEPAVLSQYLSPARRQTDAKEAPKEANYRANKGICMTLEIIGLVKVFFQREHCNGRIGLYAEGQAWLQIAVVDWGA
ncbi:Cherp [Symbiodinium necroappetens]|uniref:Cherp protein n=1 Tax=Symbiodinium necroappetens TaxID=1628268 RepID=A0A813C8P6_9DINO|nr:Cherp [Symbiodinium necroappetens]